MTTITNAKCLSYILVVIKRALNKLDSMEIRTLDRLGKLGLDPVRVKLGLG
jgi:hypothetical protein